MALNSHEIRQKYLDYFKRQGHEVVGSSSLIPAEDPTILFANAGMNQFKDCFLGREKRSYVRATSSQKCVRAGGKHNDLENVGFTARHLTFFEMLGNFSFGDYFKKEAVGFAWEFLTKELGMDPKKLYVTVFREDDEAYNLWHDIIGVPHEQISRLDEADNFWQMGDTGPCGPCSEIYVDRGTKYGCGSEKCAPGCDCDRFVEIWNNVFMQFDRQSDGRLVPLKQTGVDTGMGLERLAMILQGKDTVFHGDLFTVLHREIERLTGLKYEQCDKQKQAAFHVLSDHLRSSSFIIADGGAPSNEGRGYVLRKIIRRAALFAQKLSTSASLFYELAPAFIEDMGKVYPELKANKALIEKTLKIEVEKFSANLLSGRSVFEKNLEENRKSGAKVMSGVQIFKLYDTYGYPAELTKVLANEHGLELDMDGFATEMTKQQEQSGKKAKAGEGLTLDVPESVVTAFKGYEVVETTAPVLWVSKDDTGVWVVTEESPFYVESGGQVNDEGHIEVRGQSFTVVDLKKVGNPFGNFAIAVRLALPSHMKGSDIEIEVGDVAHSVVDGQKRIDTVKNHTATHMLQAALKQILGDGIKQAGSVVHAEYLRFDYSFPEAPSRETLEKIEQLMNEKIQEDIATEIFQTTLKDAQSKGVIAFFGEKYNPENVRVVKIPGFSAELCGGTHAPRTGIIGSFKIVSDAALATGVRRIFAVTGPQAVELFQQSYNTVKTLSELYKAKPEEVAQAALRVNDQLQKANSEIKQLKKQLMKLQVPALAASMETIGNVPYLFAHLEDCGNDELKSVVTDLEKAKPGFYFLYAPSSETLGKFSYLALVAKEHAARCDLKALAKVLQEKVGLRGGGSATSFQGGGMNISADALNSAIKEWLKQ